MHSPPLVAQMQLSLPQPGKADPLLGIDIACATAALAAGSSYGSPWGVKIDLQPCSVHHRSMKAVGGGQLQVAVFRPHLGIGLEFTPCLEFENAVNNLMQQVCFLARTCSALVLRARVCSGSLVSSLSV